MYNQLDWMIPWLINNFIPLNDKQYDLLDDRLAVIFEWHKSTQIPIYVDTLRTVIHNVENGLSSENLEYVMNLFKIYQDDFIQHVKPEMATFIKTLTDDQIRELFRNLEKNNEEYKSEKVDLPEDEIRKNSAKDMKDNLEKVLGSITDKQKQIIDDWSEHQELTGEEELAERLKWQVMFRNTLNIRHDDTFFEKRFERLFNYSESTRPAAYQEKLDFNKQLMKSTLILIDYSMTDGQREFLVNRMTKIADQLESIVED
jgi:rubrerythrin